MKKIIFGIFAFVIVFNFAVRIPVVSAAEGQLVQMDNKDAASLAGAMGTLRGLLTDVELCLADPLRNSLLDKVAVSATLNTIRGNLIAINGTLAALKPGPAIAGNPAAAPQAPTLQIERPPPIAAQGEAPNIAPNESRRGNTSLVPPAPVLGNKTVPDVVPQTAQAATNFDYGKLTWPAIFTSVGVAAIALWFWRKREPGIVAEAIPAADDVFTRPFNEQKLPIEPVELAAESLFPPKTEFAIDNQPQVQPIVYSPLRSVVYPHVTNEQESASRGKAAIHPPTIHPHVPKEKPSEKDTDISGVF